LQPAFQIASPADVQFWPGKDTPDWASVNGGMMSPQPAPPSGVYTGPVWSPCPLRYLFPVSSTLDVLIVLTV